MTEFLQQNLTKLTTLRGNVHWDVARGLWLGSIRFARLTGDQVFCWRAGVARGLTGVTVSVENRRTSFSEGGRTPRATITGFNRRSYRSFPLPAFPFPLSRSSGKRATAARSLDVVPTFESSATKPSKCYERPTVSAIVFHFYNTSTSKE